MMRAKLSKFSVLMISLVIPFLGHANEQTVRDALKKSKPGFEPESVKLSEVKGLYEVAYGPNVFYMTEDGKYILQGNLIDVAARKDLTETRVAEARVASISKVGQENMVIFKPEKTKHTISVFTDIDCGYCRKLHSELDQYHKEGIAIQYLFFPRAGVGSDSYKKAISVWCAEDRNKALTLAKNNGALEPKNCDNPVDQHMKLGAELGANGTPMLVTEKGSVFPGYIPAKKLAQMLSFESQKK